MLHSQPSPAPLRLLCAACNTQVRTICSALACMVACSEHACHDIYHTNADAIAVHICAGFFVGWLPPRSCRRRSCVHRCDDRRLGGHQRGMLLDGDGVSRRGKLFCCKHSRASLMAIPSSRHVQAFEHFYTMHLMRVKFLHDNGSKEASILGDPHGLGVQFAFACPAARKL
jgi:hypothetical protein